MIGQNRLINKLNTLTLDTFPHSLIISGSRGCGKHTLVSEISSALNLDAVDITNELNYEMLCSISEFPTPRIYIIESYLLTEKEQNVILKFIEEPSPTCYIIITTRNENLLLDTVKNRCQIWKFDAYSFEELSYFSDNSLVLKYASTPGDIIELSNIDLDAVLNISNLMIDKMRVASLSNALTLANRFNFGSESEKLNFDIFINIHIKNISDRIILGEEKDWLYLDTICMENKLQFPHLNKRNLFKNYIINVWRKEHSDNPGIKK